MNVLPKLLAFKPDLIFISAGAFHWAELGIGFDGHKNDGLNNGFGGLSESDFVYATQELVKVANSVCEGRVISVLEGGYNVLGGCTSPLALSVQAHVETLCRCFYDECSPEEWSVLVRVVWWCEA